MKMKGRNYLLITSILIMIGAIAGIALDITSVFLQLQWRISGMIFCILLLITGILGLVYRSRSAFICTVFGVLMSVISIASVPFMFWVGNGSAPAGIILSGITCFIILGLYLKGVFLNKRPSRTGKYRYAASCR